MPPEVATPPAPKAGHKQVTVKQFGEKLGVEYPLAMALIKIMELAGVASLVGKQRPKNLIGRGKPSGIYEIPESFTINLDEKIVAESVAA